MFHFLQSVLKVGKESWVRRESFSKAVLQTESYFNFISLSVVSVFFQLLDVGHNEWMKDTIKKKWMRLHVGPKRINYNISNKPFPLIKGFSLWLVSHFAPPVKPGQLRKASLCFGMNVLKSDFHTRFFILICQFKSKLFGNKKKQDRSCLSF